MSRLGLGENKFHTSSMNYSIIVYIIPLLFVANLIVY